MRKRVQTTIEENALKALDIKIIESDFFKDRSGYLDFLIRFLPFIPNDVKPDEDIKGIIRKLCVNSGIEITISDPIQKDKDGSANEISEADREIIKMAKNFKLKTTTKRE